MFRLANRLVTWFILGAIGLAIWRGSNGDLTHIADTVFSLLNKGADIVTQLWNAFMGAGKAATSAANAVSGTTP